MKRRMVTLALAGIIAVGAVAAPVTANAAENTEQTTVGYAPGGADPGGKGQYLVTVPANVILTDKTAKTGFDVTMQVIDQVNNQIDDVTASNLPKGIKVDVKVKSNKNYKLYDDVTVSSDNAGTYEYKVKAAKKDGASGEENTYQAEPVKQTGDTAASIGSLGWLNNQGEYVRGKISGQVQVTKEPLGATKGEVYTDTLTYTMTTTP